MELLISVRLLSSAPVGQALTQGISSHISHPALRAVKNGVPMATPSFSVANDRVGNGQSFTQSPQRMQAEIKSFSLRAPGGRMAVAGME